MASNISALIAVGGCPTLHQLSHLASSLHLPMVAIATDMACEGLPASGEEKVRIVRKLLETAEELELEEIHCAIYKSKLAEIPQSWGQNSFLFIQISFLRFEDAFEFNRTGGSPSCLEDSVNRTWWNFPSNPSLEKLQTEKVFAFLFASTLNLKIKALCTQIGTIFRLNAVNYVSMQMRNVKCIEVADRTSRNLLSWYTVYDFVLIVWQK